MQFSIIIPCYQPDYTFHQCITSLEKQTLSKEDFEVIVILNGTKDPYYQSITEIINRTKLQSTILYAETANVSNARNIGIKNAKGKYITFIDADDWVSPEYLSSLFSVAEQGFLPITKLLSYQENSGQLLPDYLTKKYESLNPKKHYSHINVASYFSVPVAKSFPRDIADHFFFNTEFSYGEDALFMFTIEPYLPKIKLCIDSAVYYRRITENSLSRKKRKKQEVFVIHLKLLLEYLKTYMSNILRYHFFFFLNRILAVSTHLISLK